MTSIPMVLGSIPAGSILELIQKLTKLEGNMQPLASNPAVPTFFAYSKTAFSSCKRKKAGTAGYEAMQP